MFENWSPRVLLAAVCGASLLTGSAFAQPAASPTRPNVVVILADDMGFSDLGCYGGEIHTPNIDALAAKGVRFTQFYNMARCCPTRAALLTGMYPHQAGMGAMNQDLGTPAYRGELSRDTATIAEVLRDAGYHTGMVGKWHLTHLSIAGSPEAKAMLNFKSDAPISPSKENWPCNRGFEEHWGTIPGVDDYFDPYGLVHNEETIKPDKPGFYYTDFITDHAVGLIDQFSADQKPFFMYVAYTAPHWPMHALPADIEKYKDTYKVGWDAIREARFEKQVALGIAKKQWTLSPRAFNKGLNDGPSQVGPWAEASDKEWQAQRMAVYAAMIECMDRGVGKIMAELQAKGQLDNTMVVFLSDNGACQENVQQGWYDIPTQTRDGKKIQVGNKSEFMPGPQEVYQSYGPAWANASNTPFRRFKHFTEEGGISAPFIVQWPAANLQAGRIDTRAVGDVIDLMPTVLAATGASYETKKQGKELPQLEGQNLLDLLKGTAAPQSRTLCWEHEGNRAVRIGDWKLVGPHGENWKLYNVVDDRTELHDQSARSPRRWPN
ncbi:MAG: arylsulfatase [Tepidisphaeraceae bacterium]